MSKRRKRSYPLSSTKVTDVCWFYYEHNGIHVVTQLHRKSGEYVGTTQSVIPWRTLTSAMSMHRRVQAERAASKRNAR